MTSEYWAPANANDDARSKNNGNRLTDVNEQDDDQDEQDEEDEQDQQKRHLCLPMKMHQHYKGKEGKGHASAEQHECIKTNVN